MRKKCWFCVLRNINDVEMAIMFGLLSESGAERAIDSLNIRMIAHVLHAIILLFLASKSDCSRDVCALCMSSRLGTRSPCSVNYEHL